MRTIPRPRDTKPGGPPVWHDLDPATLEVTVPQVERVVTAYPPGPDRPPAGLVQEVSSLRESATLCALFDGGDGLASILLTVRSSRLRNHRGEISFPGGRVDPGETVEEAARREAWEETALPPDQVKFIGRLPGLWTFVSSSRITPTVAVVDQLPALVPNPAEVDEIFSVSLAGLMTGGVYHQELWNLRELVDRQMHFFQLPQGVLWGATAHMIYSLCSTIVRGVREGVI